MTSLIGHATWMARHPLSAAARTLGLVKGVAGEVIKFAAGQREAEAPVARTGPVAVPDRSDARDATPDEVTRLVGIEPQPASRIDPPPGEPGESFATEPTAVTRESAHGGRGNDAEIDAWYDEASADEDELPDTIAEILAEGDGGRQPDEVVDHDAMHAEISRSETLRRAAERD